MALVAMAIMLLAPVVESNAQISRDYRHSESYQDAVNRAAEGIKGLFKKKKTDKGSKKNTEKGNLQVSVESNKIPTEQNSLLDTTSIEKTSRQPATTDDMSQGDIDVIASGDGNTKEEATQSALRSAIEQVYGTFVSSNTEILNDKLVKDEIATVSSGNVKSFNYISENCISNKYFVVLKVIVSRNSLISYVKAKGGETEFAGGVFAMNVKLKQWKQENLDNTMLMLRKKLTKIFPYVFDYEIVVNDPSEYEFESGHFYSNVYEVDGMVLVKANKNAEVCSKMFYDVADALGLSGGWSDCSQISYYTHHKGKSLDFDFGHRYNPDRIFQLPLQEAMYQNICNFKITDGTRNYIFGLGESSVGKDKDGYFKIICKNSEDKSNCKIWCSYGDQGDCWLNYHYLPILADRHSSGKVIAEIDFKLFPYTLDELSKITNFTIEKMDIVGQEEKYDPYNLDVCISHQNVNTILYEKYKKDKESTTKELLEIYDEERVKKCTHIMDVFIRNNW